MKTRNPVDLLDAVRYFADPNICRQFLAEARWPNGVTCPRKGCGSKENWFIQTRAIWRCKKCLKQFSVKVGSIFEDSPLGLDKWLPAVWLLTAATKGYSSHRLAKALSVTQKTAWFMLHRIRLAMRAGSFETPLSGEVEGDTTGVGGKEKNKHRSKRLHRGTGNTGKAIVFGLLSRHGQVRAKSVPSERAETLQAIIRRNVESGAIVYTDQAAGFRGLDRDYAHQVINHAEEYVRGNVHTNSIEGFWSQFKRTIYGTHHFVMPWQLDRYLDNATFRFNNRNIPDGERFALACAQTDGKRLTWNQLTGKED
ncbi:IS1595 family transposase [Candidatus Binatus sp.]|jgi:transposase-like protein|uniref:IS1595 family transposase n=1 Tax=Candidatus Binatus sp. TaxID=2811406 RepID=UPI003BC538D5